MQTETGGESPRGKEWLIVGRAGKPHGVHGSLLVEIVTDFPERMVAGIEVGVGTEDEVQQFVRIHEVRYHRGRWLLDFEGLRQREDVDAWRGRFLYLPEQSMEELPEGFFYEHHLVGLECQSLAGESLGTVTGLEEGPGQQRLVVRRGKREFLVPWVPQIVIKIDLENGTVLLDPPGGLLDDDAELA
ncbi:MAG: ribosome maturation factor RimM [Thermoanaerobaculales bacterium]|nr:ribosome maturation factor RimM [Thermoanaerobaculales bacterium]